MPNNEVMLTHQEPIMQHNRMKAADPSASSQESLYRLLMQQQQQQQHESASFRGLGARGLANFTGNFSMNPSSLGLGSFALPNYPSLNTTTPSSLALSRQQLLQSLIAAEEREMYQRRLALEGRLALQQQMNFSSPPPPQQSFMPSMIPPSQDFTNVQVDPEANFGRKRSFEETAYEKPEFALGQLPEVKKEAPPASVSTPTEPTRAESTPQVIEPSVKSAPAISRKPAPKKKNSKKSPKRSDSSVASEPKKDTKWLNMLEELKTYKAKYGNCIVPRGYSPNPRLASWVAEQRKQYKLMTDGKPTSITPERISKLKELDFAWNAQEAAWARHMNDLKAYKEEHGHCHVPLSHTTFPKLGLWVKEQRRHFTLLQQGKPSHMTEARAKELNSVGFCWDTHEATWLERLRQLKDYKNRHGDCLVPTHFGVNPKLGTWVNHQRRQYKKFHEGKPCHITQERIEQLEEIGFCWDTRGESDNSTSTDCSDSESESGSLPPRKRHRLMM